MCHPSVAEAVRERVEREGPPQIESLRLTRRHALVAGAVAVLGAAVPGAALAGRGGRNRVADLTHVYSEDFPLFLGAPIPVERDVVVTVPANGFYAQRWSFWEHSGTHMDAPAHFIAAGRQVPQLDVEELIAPVVVVDISHKVPGNADAVIEPDDLVAFERRHGRIPDGAVVCAYSGWESRAGSVAAYQNIGADGLQHFPGFGADAAAWLIAHRDITGIGVDTMSLDPGASLTFATHYTVLGANRYGIENLRNLATIPPRGATIFVGIVPWKNGSGGPLRAIATW